MAIAERTRLKINLAAFLVLAVVLIYLMASNVLTLLQDRFHVFATFRDSGGVFTNQEVTYRGVQVGQVGRLEIVPEGVRIELNVEEGVRIPKEGVEARVMFRSAVGEQFVDILPTSDGAPYLEDGDEIPLENTSIPVSTQALLSTLQAVLQGVPPEAVKGAIDALGEGLTDRGHDIATILEATADIAELFARRSPEIEGILEEGTKVGGAFLDSRAAFVKAIRELVTVSETLAQNTGNLENLLRGGSLMSDEVVALIRENRPELHRFLIEFADMNALQAEHADDLARLLQKLPSALNRVNRTFEPDTGLVRFGFIGNPGSIACSYATRRRPPEKRGPRPIPKDARCESPPGSQEQSGRSVTVVPEDVSLDTRGPVLPSRMSDWSWSLLYLNGL